MKTLVLTIPTSLKEIKTREVFSKGRIIFNKVSSNVESVTTYFSTTKDSFTSRATSSSKSLKGRIKRPSFQLPSKKTLKYLGYGLGLFVLILIVRNVLGSSSNDKNATKIQVQEAKAVQSIDREFEFPLRDENDEEVASFKYQVEKVELLDEIIVDGKRFNSVEGRTFLVVYLKLKNDLDKTIQIKSRDFVRLSVNENTEEWLAPDMHNDPVQIQAISTKNTRLGFMINDSDSNLQLQIGEINGEKEIITIDF